MKRKSIMPLGLIALTCTSCSLRGNQHNIQDYIAKMAYHDNFNIVQLTDLHFSSYDDLDEDFSFIDKMYEDQKGKLDLVVLSGDIFTFASKATIKAVFNYFDSKNIPWTLTFGNHDEQLYASYTFASEYAASLKNSVYKHVDDDMNGIGNNIIHLVNGEEVKFQIFVIDSNTYTYIGQTGYDYIHEDQIEWYKKGVNLVNEGKADADKVKSIIVQHIPLPEINEASKLYVKEDGSYFDEKPCPPKYNSGFFDVIKNMKATTGIYFGHDHINNFQVTYEGVVFAYGVKSTDNMYNSEKMLGYRTITISNGGKDVTSKCYFHTYKEGK